MFRALGALLLILLAGTAGAAPPRDDGLIVFWSESPWPSIWSMRPDGSQVRRVLRNRQNAKRPRLSPDRKWVAFDGASPGKPVLTDFDIQVVRVDGSGLRTLTPTPRWDHDAQWSPNGRLLSFTRRPPDRDWQRSSIWTIRADGSALRRIARGHGARWSPDGERIVFDAPTARSPGDLFVANADGSGRRLLLASKGLDQAAGWSPDGRQILFTRFLSSSGNVTDVYVVNRDGTGARKLADGAAGSWSPDGSKILYVWTSQLWVMNRDGSGKRRISRLNAAEPDWG